MKMLPEFRPMTLENIEEWQPYLSHQPYRICDFTVGAIYMWQKYYNYHFIVQDDLLVIRGRDERGIDMYSFPVGPGDKKKMLKRLLDLSGGNLLMTVVPEGCLDFLNENYMCSVTATEDWFDYLYNFEEMRGLDGKKYANKRNHISKFLRLYPDYSFEKLTYQHIPELRAFMEKFVVSHGEESSLFDFESARVLDVFDDYERLDFSGFVLKVEGNVAGFTIYEIEEDTVYTHIEKADTQYQGAYPFITNSTLVSIKDPNLKYVNREEDVGDLGMRASKMSYHPVELLKKFDVVITAIK